MEQLNRKNVWVTICKTTPFLRVVVKKKKILRFFTVYRTELVYLCYEN